MGAALSCAHPKTWYIRKAGDGKVLGPLTFGKVVYLRWHKKIAPNDLLIDAAEVGGVVDGGPTAAKRGREPPPPLPADDDAGWTRLDALPAALVARMDADEKRQKRNVAVGVVVGAGATY